MSEQTKKVLAVALVALLGLLLARNLGLLGGGDGDGSGPRPADPSLDPSGEGPRRTGPGRTGPRRTNRGPQVTPENMQVEELALAALAPRPREYEIGRNLWSFYQAPPPVLPPVAPPPVVEREEPPPPPPPVVETGPQLPVIDFRYIGAFGPKARRIAVFSDDLEIINALEGDVIKNEFRVAKIGFQSVFLEYTRFPDEKAKQLAIGG